MRDAVASPHYLASQAGLDVLLSGGNAVDAAIATNMVLAVVYPHMCGLGGDLFAMVWNDGGLAGLASSGVLPAAAPRVEKAPRTGIGAASVPGCVAGWRALHDRYGARPLSELAQPAIRYAREGVERAPGFARITGLMRPLLERDEEATRIYLSDEPLVQPELAETLEHLDEFESYVGSRAPEPFAEEDFRDHEAEWVTPVRREWQGVTVCEMPPHSRGHLVLEALGRLEPLDDLSPADAEWHRRLMRAHGPGGMSSDTIYLCVRDEEGMCVSLSQSLKDAFGCGVVIPGTGVLLQNRAADFTPETYIGGAKVPEHTLAPAMVLGPVAAHPSSPLRVSGKESRVGSAPQGERKDASEPLLVFGTMGGPSQTQIHLQLLSRIFVAGEGVGEAIAAPRWRMNPGGLIADGGLPEIGAQEAPVPDMLGHAHAIMVMADGTVEAAADPRSDGAALGE
jgi:gamma-glutamyltranspeptidase/glutathione hydrolase